jgi:lysophospholipase L1-like esterase
MLTFATFARAALCSMIASAVQSAAPSAAPAATLNVVLLGDSLINRPTEMFNLTQLLATLTEPPPNTTLNFINSGDNGQEIKDILARTEAVMQQYAPVWGTILFWDSDCSNIDESKLTPAEVDQLRANYSANLLATEKIILSHTPRLAVAGPELLGEGPLGLPDRFANKTQMLDDYRLLTRAAADAVDVPYIDMRAAFMAEIPDWWLIYAGWVTIDGEHPNARGTQIEAELFATTINVWLREPPAA